jgi:predicted HicB family RNase H-like nuclease
MPKKPAAKQKYETAAEYRDRTGLKQLNIQVSPELAERARIAAIKADMRLSEYLSAVLEEALPDD